MFSILILSAWLTTVVSAVLWTLAMLSTSRAGSSMVKSIIAGVESTSKGGFLRPSRERPIWSVTISSMSLAGFGVWVWTLAALWSLIPKWLSIFYLVILSLGTLSGVLDLSLSLSMLAAYVVAGRRKTR